MAQIDDPKTWILQLFKAEDREGRSSGCGIHDNGIRPDGLPLDDGEKVFGVYKEKYFFTPISLMVAHSDRIDRIPWAEICACSSEHGQGKTYSEVTLLDGRTFRVRVGDMATGWSGRISQLFHQLIECHGSRAAMGRALMPANEFFEKADDNFCIAPNLEPHPSLDWFRDTFQRTVQFHDGTCIYLDLAEDEDEFVAIGAVLVTTMSKDEVEHFAGSIKSDGFEPADEGTVRKVGEVQSGFRVWCTYWD